MPALCAPAPSAAGPRYGREPGSRALAERASPPQLTRLVGLVGLCLLLLGLQPAPTLASKAALSSGTGRSVAV